MTIRTICVATALAAATLGFGSAANAQYHDGGRYEERGRGYDRGYDHRGYDHREYGRGYGYGHYRPDYGYRGGYGYHGGYGFRGYDGYRGGYRARCWTEWRYHHRVRICR